MAISLFYLTLLLLGIGFGFVSSTPLGPINLLVAENYLGHPKIRTKPFLAGVIITDAVFALLAFWGYNEYIKGTTIGSGIAIIGGLSILLLGVLGLYQILSKKPQKSSKSKIRNIFKTSDSANFMKGAFLCGSNPGFIMYWAGVASIIQGIIEEQFPEIPLAFSDLSLFSIGIVAGDFLWFGLFIYLLKKGAKRFSNKIIDKIRLVISVGLTLLGIYTLIFMV